jgi:LysR family transcriptional regulator, transcriptional activator for dmlA
MLAADQYRLFVRIAASRSFAEVARQLEVSPAAITRRIAAIEQSLGVRLVSRTTRAIRLTEEGELFLTRARAIVHSMDEAEEELRSRSAKPSGSLTISAPLSFGRRHIAPLVGNYARLHPDVGVRLCLSDVSDDLAAGDFDLAIRVGAPDKGDYIARRILSAGRLVCAAPSYLALYGEPQHPADLQAHRCLAIVRDDIPLDRWMFQVDGVAETVRVPVTLASNSGEVVQAWAEAGLGVALKSRWDVMEELASGRLVELLADHCCDRADIFAVYRDKRNLPLRTRSFLDFLTDALRAVEARLDTSGNAALR